MARLEIGQIIAVIKEKLPEAVVEEVLDGKGDLRGIVLLPRSA